MAAVGGVLLFLAGLFIGQRTALPVTTTGYGEEAPVPSDAAAGPSNSIALSEATAPRSEVRRAEGDTREADLGLSEAPTPKGLIALVIDDLGRSVRVVEQLEQLGIEISFSVLPFESKTAEVLELLRARRREVLLHLPMEGGSGADPGPGGLYVDMTPSELVRRTEAALEAVPAAIGVNNHMGSRLSAIPSAMRTVLATIGERQLFFLDSRTSPESVAYDVAKELGLAATRRHVFLDGQRSRPAIRAQFQRTLDRAQSHGSAVAIGHPYVETLEVLAEEVPRAMAEGYRFVPVSWLIEPPSVALGSM